MQSPLSPPRSSHQGKKTLVLSPRKASNSILNSSIENRIELPLDKLIKARKKHNSRNKMLKIRSNPVKKMNLIEKNRNISSNSSKGSDNSKQQRKKQVKKLHATKPAILIVNLPSSTNTTKLLEQIKPRKVYIANQTKKNPNTTQIKSKPSHQNVKLPATKKAIKQMKTQRQSHRRNVMKDISKKVKSRKTIVVIRKPVSKSHKKQIQ